MIFIYSMRFNGALKIMIFYPFVQFKLVFFWATINKNHRSMVEKIFKQIDLTLLPILP